MQNLMADVVARERPQETLEQKRLEQASADVRGAAALRALEAELMEFEAAARELSNAHKLHTDKVSLIQRKMVEVALGALRADEFAARFRFDAVPLAHLGLDGANAINRFIADLALVIGTSRETIAVASLTDLSSSVISKHLLHQLSTVLAALPTDSVNVVLYPVHATGHSKNHDPAAASSTPSSDSPTSIPAEETESECETLAAAECSPLPAAKKSRQTYHRTTSEELAQLATDRFAVDQEVGRANTSLRAPVPLMMRLGPDASGSFYGREGFALLPITRRHDEAAWYNTLEFWNSHFVTGELTEVVYKCGKEAAVVAGGDPPGCRVTEVPRRLAPRSAREQKGPGAFKELLTQLARAAKQAGKSALAVVVPFAGAGDAVLAMYQLHVDGVADGFQVAAVGFEHNARRRTVASARLRSAAFADFNAQKLRIPGHAPVVTAPMAAGPAPETCEAVVAKMRRDFRYAIVCSPPAAVGPTTAAVGGEVAPSVAIPRS